MSHRSRWAAVAGTRRDGAIAIVVAALLLEIGQAAYRLRPAEILEIRTARTMFAPIIIAAPIKAAVT
jgi:D-arabinose 5-phosphate isomerase GutQ